MIVNGVQRCTPPHTHPKPPKPPDTSFGSRLRLGHSPRGPMAKIPSGATAVRTTGRKHPNCGWPARHKLRTLLWPHAPSRPLAQADRTRQQPLGRASSLQQRALWCSSSAQAYSQGPPGTRRPRGTGLAPAHTLPASPGSRVILRPPLLLRGLSTIPRPANDCPNAFVMAASRSVTPTRGEGTLEC